MIKLFDDNYQIDICYEGENKYVKKAIGNLIADFLRVNKWEKEPKLYEVFINGAILIHTEDENKSVGMGEGFSIKTVGDNIIIRGAGYLGTIYGIYTFSEKVLGISPCFHFNDFEIAQKESLSVDQLNIFDYPKTFRFRGMFINDEDLLTDWVESKKQRYIDYPFYQTVTDLSVIDKVTETAMRLKMNLIIPASFLDIQNENEKEIIDVVTSHGIFISQHHIEPCGVSHFGFENFAKKNHIEGDASYVSNKENMIRVWSDYVEKWAMYENVVWQIGLRGKADKPVWESDEDVPLDWEERGRIVSEAYQVQKDIILKKTKGRAKYFTSTLWMEGSLLYRKGVLKFPDDTIIVLSDIGINQMFGNDFNLFERNDTIKRGIYYHLQYWGAGPHLIAGVGLDKMCYNINRCVDNKDTDYIIINSSNIREFTYELGAYSHIVWDFESFSKEKYLDDYADGVSREYKNEICGLVRDYYDCFSCVDNKFLRYRGSDRFDYNYEEYVCKIKNHQINDGLTALDIRILLDGITNHDYEYRTEYFENLAKVHYDSILKFENLIKNSKELLSRLNENASRHVLVKWINGAYIMMSLYKACDCVFMARKFLKEDNKDDAVKYLKEAMDFIDKMIDFRKCAEYGEFENWYRGDKKLNAKKLKKDIEKVITFVIQ